MKRLQIMIDEEIDAALERMAVAEGTSKAALIRRFVARHVRSLPPVERDPLWELVGIVEGAHDDSASIDDVVYGRAADR